MANFNLIIDTKKNDVTFVDNKLSASLPETLFFTGDGVWEIALVSAWYNKKPNYPIYINCSMIETQMTGNKWEKTLFVLLPATATLGVVADFSGSYRQYKKIFEPHVSKMTFSFFRSNGDKIEFRNPQTHHMIFNLNIRNRRS